MAIPSPDSPRPFPDSPRPFPDSSRPLRGTDPPLSPVHLPDDGQPAPVDQVDVDLSGLTPVMTRRELRLVTERAFHVVDVTDHCDSVLADSQAQHGTLTVYSPHTTCAVKINERETCFLEDLRLFMNELVPDEAYYRHDDFEIRDRSTLDTDPAEEPLNGHSHIQQMLIGSASESVPIVEGRLGLGRWQRVMFIELDQSRPRRIHLHVQGWR